jgi:hypothetical protein
MANARYQESIPSCPHASSVEGAADGTFACLGSETRLRLMLSERLSLVTFIDRCLIPHLYRFSYLEIHRRGSV